MLLLGSRKATTGCKLGWGASSSRPPSLWPFCRENAENMYYFSELALILNEPEEGVAPTDSRWRPDQRLMENGQWDEANSEKQRLEEKQRMIRRKRLESSSHEHLEEGKPRTPRS